VSAKKKKKNLRNKEATDNTQQRRRKKLYRVVEPVKQVTSTRMGIAMSTEKNASFRLSSPYFNLFQSHTLKLCQISLIMKRLNENSNSNY